MLGKNRFECGYIELKGGRKTVVWQNVGQFGDDW